MVHEACQQSRSCHLLLFKIQQEREKEELFKIQQEREELFKIQQERESALRRAVDWEQRRAPHDDNEEEEHDMQLN